MHKMARRVKILAHKYYIYVVLAKSRWPIDRLQLKYVFALCDPMTLTFDLLI